MTLDKQKKKTPVFIGITGTHCVGKQPSLKN